MAARHYENITSNPYIDRIEDLEAENIDLKNEISRLNRIIENETTYNNYSKQSLIGIFLSVEY